VAGGFFWRELRSAAEGGLDPAPAGDEPFALRCAGQGAMNCAPTKAARTRNDARGERGLLLLLLDGAGDVLGGVGFDPEEVAGGGLVENEVEGRRIVSDGNG
jgi:hypothetical protein